MPFRSEMVKNSMASLARVSDKKPVHPEKTKGRTGLGSARTGRQDGQEALEGRFIWQLVGVLETYGSICLIGTKV